MRRTVAALLAAILNLSVQVFPVSAETPAAYAIEKKAIPFVYCFDKEARNSEINLWQQTSDIPARRKPRLKAR